MQFATEMLINGELVGGDRILPVFDPATGKLLVEVACASPAQAESAIAAAKQAQRSWEALAWEEREATLVRLADAIGHREAEFAESIVREQGKPLAQARGEVLLSERFIRHFAGMRFPVASIEGNESSKVEVGYRALGVAVGITPWNFPLLTAAAKLAAALVTGNTIVLKPAPTTPITGLLLGAVASSAVPPGVVNVVTDRNDLGTLLTSHRDVAKIAFTGSTATGRKIMAAAAPTLKRLTLELGGNDAAIVLDDVDVPRTVEKIHRAAYFNAGQACLAVKRVYVAAPIYDEFCEALAERARSTVVGNGMDPGTEIGPIQNDAQYQKTRRYLEVAHRDGKVIAGGAVAPIGGMFVEPTVVRDIGDGSPLVDEEQFCPVLPLVRVSSDEEALARANDSEFGLGGSVWSADPQRAQALAARFQSGTVWINQHLNFGPDIPFAGAKQSGIGVKWGELGLTEYGQVTVINEAVDPQAPST